MLLHSKGFLSNNNNLSPLVQLIVLLSSLANLPVYSIHYWLPNAHVQAPTILSVILASLCLKVGLVILYFLFTSLTESSWLVSTIIFYLIISIYLSCMTSALSVDTNVFLSYCSVSHINISYVSCFS